MTYIIFRLLDNLLDLCQVSPFKTAKHWDSFFTPLYLLRADNLVSCVVIPNELRLELRV
jgi:hypothetical protein